MTVGKDVLDGNIKLAHVIFTKSILVPADSLEQQTVNACDGHVKRLIPFRIQGLGHDRRGLSAVADSDDKILQTWSVV